MLEVGNKGLDIHAFCNSPRAHLSSAAGLP